MKAYNLGRVVGLSAYEIAVIKGYEGSIEEWLESLRYDHSDEYKQFTETIEQPEKRLKPAKAILRHRCLLFRILLQMPLPT